MKLNPAFDASSVGDLPVLCQGFMKMLQVIFVPVRIRYGFSTYIAAAGQARVTLTFHPPLRLLSCLSDISDFPQTWDKRLMRLMLASVLILVFPLKNVETKIKILNNPGTHHWGWCLLCVSRGSLWESCLSCQQGHTVIHIFDFTSVSNLTDFNRITVAFKIRPRCKGLGDYEPR